MNYAAGEPISTQVNDLILSHVEAHSERNQCGPNDPQQSGESAYWAFPTFEPVLRDQVIDRKHELVQPAEKLDWVCIEGEIASLQGARLIQIKAAARRCSMISVCPRAD
jgi:hypothetical protein